MNVTDLRQALDDLAGPLPSPTTGQRAAVDRRVRRSRLARSAGVAVVAVVIAVGALVVANPWNGSDETKVVTSGSTTVHDEERGYTVTLPPGWTRHPVVVDRDDPLPIILTIDDDSYVPSKMRGGCATSVQQQGIAILVQELVYTKPDPDMPPAFNRRPVPFGPDSAGGLHVNAGSPVCHRLEQSMIFDDQGRRFSISVTMADDTRAARRAEAYAIVNGLEFDRGTFIDPSFRSTDTSTTVTTVRGGP